MRIGYARVSTYTAAQIAAEFGVTRPTIYRHLARSTAGAPRQLPKG